MIKINRPSNHKLKDIKSVRALTRLLGKLHIPSCYCKYTSSEHRYDGDGMYIGTFVTTKEGYGFGLKEAMDFINRWFDYNNIQDSESDPWMPWPR